MLLARHSWAAPAFALGAMLVADTLVYAVLPNRAAAFGLSSWQVGVLLASNRLVRLVAMPLVVRRVRQHGTSLVLSFSVLAAATAHLVVR